MLFINSLIGLFLNASVAVATPSVFLNVSVPSIKTAQNNFVPRSVLQKNIPRVPFYSQFHDIERVEWQKLGCGIADLAMIIDFYKPGIVSVGTLLEEGISFGAFRDGAGWKHKDLVSLARRYGFYGSTHDLSNFTADAAFIEFEKFLNEGPVIASVHYRFDPKSTIPHLAVINGVSGDTLYYNDPAGARGGESISVPEFKEAWKKRFIVIRPLEL